MYNMTEIGDGLQSGGQANNKHLNNRRQSQPNSKLRNRRPSRDSSNNSSASK